MKKFLPALITILVTTMPSYAVMWETVYEAKTANETVRVDIDRHSVNKRYVNGDTHVRYRARYEYNKGNETVKAKAQYLIHCNSREAWTLESELSTYVKNKLQGKLENKEKTKVTGKDYQDLQGIMDEMCK